MASKEDKKSKAPKTEVSSPGPDTPKKKDSVEVIPEAKGKGKREKVVKTSVPLGTLTKGETGLGNLQRVGATERNDARYGEIWSDPSRNGSWFTICTFYALYDPLY